MSTYTKKTGTHYRLTAEILIPIEVLDLIRKFRTKGDLSSSDLEIYSEPLGIACSLGLISFLEDTTLMVTKIGKMCIEYAEKMEAEESGTDDLKKWAIN